MNTNIDFDQKFAKLLRGAGRQSNFKFVKYLAIQNIKKVKNRYKLSTGVRQSTIYTCFLPFLYFV